VHPAPSAEARACYRFDRFDDGVDAVRRVVRRGATPAVLRLYDTIESDRHFDVGDGNILLVLDEGDTMLVDGVMRVVQEECHEAAAADPGFVDTWLAHRNDVSALERYVRDGFVVDTLEIAASWSSLPGACAAVLAALRSVDGTALASVHLSHAYGDGACCYFTFGGLPPKDRREHFYRAAWDAAIGATLEAGAAVSHHHGIGLNRSRFARAALGEAFDVLVALKRSLDPHGILNPGKLGLPHPWGEPAWP
jgi:alkyldihydroxyacetonephosphate synthase